MSAFPTQQPFDQCTCAPSFGILTTHCLQYILVPFRQLSLPQTQPGSRRKRTRYTETACPPCGTNFAKPKQESTLLQHYLPFLLCANASPPTNIRQSNFPNQLAAYHAGSFLNKPPHTQKPTGSWHTLYTTIFPLASSHRPVNAQRYSCQIHCSV